MKGEKRLHYQPIRRRAVDIIDDIRAAEEVASLGEEDYGIIRLAIEELVLNVVKYAYPEKSAGAQGQGGTKDYLDVEIIRNDKSITLRFRDGGVPFNPLKAEAPDTSLPIEQHEMGGFGIFMVVNYVDSIDYEYTAGENITTVVKKLNN